jgi:DNA polymerase III subunit alpha
MLATIFDTETTGLIDNQARKLDAQPEIISIAIQEVNLATAAHNNLYYRIFHPTHKISMEIVKITGLTNEMLLNAPSIKDHMPIIINKLQEAPLLIGQNIKFDMNMVELECKRYGYEINWPRTLDLVENSIFIKGFRLTLTNLHQELFGKGFEGAHDAAIDVSMTAKCAIEMWKRGWL